VFEHGFEAAKGILDLKLSRNLLRASRGNIGDGNQARTGDEVANIFRVPSAHLADSQNPNAQLGHIFRTLP